MKLSPARKKSFQHKILQWYALNKRDLPWRKTKDPYKILISEVMLQQTQVERVIPYYERWLLKFPDFAALAKAEKTDVLRLWSGLGYNNRVLRLQRLAQGVVERYQGTLPREKEKLLELPGIGHYTSAAVLAFAFNQEIAVVDTNIRRVLIHELGLQEDIASDDLQEIARSVIPKGNSCIWHNALMDYGAMYATARKTKIASLSKQSKFEGSDREVRGWIVKQLTSGKILSLQEVKKAFPDKGVKEILARMEGEGMVKKEGRRLIIT